MAGRLTPSQAEPRDPIGISLRTPYPIGAVNVYLLADDPITLIDTGPDDALTMQDLKRGLGREGLRLDDVEQVLLTHHHADHVGLAGKLQREHGCSIVGQALLREYLGDAVAARTAEVQYQSELMAIHGVPSAVIESFRDYQATFFELVESLQLDRIVEDGEVLAAGGHELTVKILPGHSRSDTLFVSERDRFAFVGDQLLEHTASDPLANRPPTGPRELRRRHSTALEYRKALRRAEMMDLKVMYSGHGEEIRNHRDLIGRRLRRQERLMGRVLDVLGSGPSTGFAIASEIWGETAERKPFVALSTVLGALDLAAGEDRVHENDSSTPVEFALMPEVRAVTDPVSNVEENETP